MSSLHAYSVALISQVALESYGTCAITKLAMRHEPPPLTCVGKQLLAPPLLHVLLSAVPVHGPLLRIIQAQRLPPALLLLKQPLRLLMWLLQLANFRQHARRRAWRVPVSVTPCRRPVVVAGVEEGVWAAWHHRVQLPRDDGETAGARGCGGTAVLPPPLRLLCSCAGARGRVGGAGVCAVTAVRLAGLFLSRFCHRPSCRASHSAVLLEAVHAMLLLLLLRLLAQHAGPE